MRTIALAPALSLLAVACGGRIDFTDPVLKDASEPTESHPRPTASWEEAMAFFATDQARARSTNALEKGIAKAVALVMRARSAEAERVLANLGSMPPRRADAAQALADQLRFGRGAFAELAGDMGDDALMASYRSLPPPTVTFPAEPVVLPASASGSGVPVVTAKVNGEPVTLWVDTGAGLTVLSSTTAEDVGAESIGRASTAGTGTSRRVGIEPTVVDLDLGGVEFAHHPAIIIDARDLKFARPGQPTIEIQGIVGWPALARLDLTVDMPSKTLTIRDPRLASHSEHPTLFWFGYPIVRGTSPGGTALFFGLDTGAATSTLAPPIMRALDVEPARMAGMGVWSAGGGERQRVPVIGDARFTLADVEVAFAERPVSDASVGTLWARLDGIVGMDVVGQRRVRVDATNGVFSLQAP